MQYFLHSLRFITRIPNYSLAIFITTSIVALVGYQCYKVLKSWLQKYHKYLLYAFLEAFHLPFFVFIWIEGFKLIYHATPALNLLLFTNATFLGFYTTVRLILATWFIMRFMVSMQSLVSVDYIQNQKMIRFLTRLCYYMLVLLSIVAGLQIFGITLSRRLTAIGYSFIAINFVVVLLYFTHVVLLGYAKLFSQENFFYRQMVVQALRDPIKVFIVGIGLNFIIQKWEPLGYLSGVKPILSIIQYREAIWISLFWMFYKLTVLAERNLLLGNLTDKYPDRVMVQTSSKFSRILIIAVGLFILFNKIDNKTFFAYFGGSAVFFGFVGKDIFPNYLGGLILYIEDRFKVGEWIYSADSKIEGTIEAIDLRSVSIRTFDKRLVIVPSVRLVSDAFFNASRMTNRRIKETIRIERTSHEKLAKIVQDIRLMLEKHPGIDQQQRRMVHFIKLGDYSLNIELYTYTKTIELETYRNVQQDVLLKVMEIVANNKTKLALPTSNMHIQKMVKQESDNLLVGP